MAYTRVTLAELDQRLIERSGQNSTFWVSEERRDAINEAVSVWGAVTGFWSTTFPVTADGSAFYTVPKQLMSVTRVLFNGTALTLISLPELDYGFSGWSTASTGTPQFWAPSGLNEIAIYPRPANGILTLEGITEAPWLSAPGDYLDMGDEDITRVLQYGHHFLTFKEAGAEFEATAPEMQEFLSAAADRNGRLRATTFYRRWLGLDRAGEERAEKVQDTPPGARA